MCGVGSITLCAAVVDSCWAVVALGFGYNILCACGVLTNVVHGGAFFRCCISICL